MRKRRKSSRRSNKPGRPQSRLLTAERVAFLCIVAVAAALRISYGLASRQSPFFDHLDLDSRFYDLWAKQIAGGDWVGDEVFFMGPLYSYFLAVIYRIAGSDLVMVKVVQGLLGGLTAGFTFLLAREGFGFVVGLIAGLFAAVYVPFIFYDNSILFPVLATLLNTLMLYWLYRGVCRRSVVSFLIAGLFGGLSAAGNASVLAFGPLAVVALLVSFKVPLRFRLKAISLLAAGAAAVVLPITIRNLAVGNDFVPLTSNAGLNLYIGNNAKSTGAYVKPEGLDVYTDPSGRTIAEAALGRPLKSSEVSTYWTGRVYDFIESNPGRFASNMLRKAFLFWSVYEIPQIEHLPFEKRYSWILRIPAPSFGIICPLGILGMCLLVRQKREAWLLFLFIVSYSLTITAFFVVARYRLPMVPTLMVFAAYAVSWWISSLAGKRYRAFAVSAVGFVLLYMVVHTNFYKVDPRSGFAQSHYRLGIIYEGKDKPAEAMASYREALEIDPSLTAAYLNLGILLSRQGKYAEAKQELLKAVGQDPGYARAYYNLGLVYAEQADADSALLLLDRAIELDSDYRLAKLAKAGVYYESLRLAAAESLLVYLEDDVLLSMQARNQAKALLKVIPERRRWISTRTAEIERRADRYLVRGDNLLSLGLVDRALQAYLRAVETDGGSGIAHYQVGTIYFNKGDFAEALKHFDAALRGTPRLEGAHFARGVIAFRRGDIGTACREFEEELRIDPASSASHINLAMCYEEHLQDLERAAYHMTRYIELTGGTEELRRHLKELEARIKDEE